MNQWFLWKNDSQKAPDLSHTPLEIKEGVDAIKYNQKTKVLSILVQKPAHSSSEETEHITEELSADIQRLDINGPRYLRYHTEYDNKLTKTKANLIISGVEKDNAKLIIGYLCECAWINNKVVEIANNDLGNNYRER